MTIYPNLTSTHIPISTPTQGHLLILNLSGQTILHQEITEPNITTDVSGLKSGFYFVRVTGEKTVKVGKLVKH